MKVLVIVLHLSIALTQEIPPLTFPPPIPPPTMFVSGLDSNRGNSQVGRCYVGSFVRDKPTMTMEVDCDFNRGNSCQTKIEARPGFYQVVRHCQQTNACQNNQNGNVPKCYPGENNVRQCFYCCSSDLCNNFIDIPQMNEMK